MKKIIFYTLAFCCVWGGSVQANPKTITLLNWDNYIDPELLTRFEKQHGIRVKVVAFGSGQERDGMMLTTQTKGIDLVVGTGLGLDRYYQLGYLQTVDRQQIPNLKHIHPKWLPKERLYRIPYLWGTTGILYRKDKIQITRWSDLYRPSPALQGKIQLVPDFQVIVGFALKALGYSLNSHNIDEILEAKGMLQELKPHIKAIGEVYARPSSGLVTGEVWAAINYNGMIKKLEPLNANIAYVVPEEGGQVWMDSIGVVKKETPPTAALQFINFLHEPKNAAQLTKYTGYATPNQAASRWLPEDILKDPSIYLTDQQIEVLETFAPLPVDINRSYIDAMAVLKD